MSIEARRGSFTPNPVFGSMLGLSPILAAASTLDRGLALGIGIMLTAILVCGLSWALRDRIPEPLRATLSIAAAGAFSGFYSLVLVTWSPSLAAGLGLFIPLIAVNGFVIHRVEQSLRNDVSGRQDIFRSSAAYFASIVLIAGIREILGTGFLSIPVPGLFPMRINVLPFSPIRILLTPAGGFILVGLIAAAWRAGLRASGRIVR